MKPRIYFARGWWRVRWARIEYDRDFQRLKQAALFAARLNVAK